jgi:hypothetical protein
MLNFKKFKNQKPTTPSQRHLIQLNLKIYKKTTYKKK